jgi:hypothetical protein
MTTPFVGLPFGSVVTGSFPVLGPRHSTRLGLVVPGTLVVRVAESVVFVRGFLEEVTLQTWRSLNDFAKVAADALCAAQVISADVAQDVLAELERIEDIVNRISSDRGAVVIRGRVRRLIVGGNAVGCHCSCRIDMICDWIVHCSLRPSSC